MFSAEPYGVGLTADDAALRNKVNDLLQASEHRRHLAAALRRDAGPLGHAVGARRPTIERY